MPTLATLFCAILSSLRSAVAAHSGRVGVRGPIFGLLWGRLGRTASRFEALFARWQAGKLPKRREPRASRPTTPRERPRLPQGRAWLLHEPEIFRLPAAGSRSQLEHLFANPTFEQFVQAVPQAGRILRPLCHMLGIDPPGPLRPPPRPPRFRQPRAPKPRAPKPPPFNIPLKRPRLPPVMFPARPRSRPA